MPVPHIPLEQMIKAIKLMKCAKAAGTSLIVPERLKACGDEGIQQICDWQLRQDPYWIGGAYYHHPLWGKGRRPWAWKLSSLELLYHVTKILERVAQNVLRQQVPIDDTQSCFMPYHSATDAIFIACHPQEKFHAVNKTMYRPLSIWKMYLVVCPDVLPRRLCQPQHWLVADTPHTEHAWKCEKSVCWLQPEWKCEYDSESSLWLFSETLLFITTL